MFHWRWAILEVSSTDISYPVQISVRGSARYKKTWTVRVWLNKASTKTCLNPFIFYECFIAFSQSKLMAHFESLDLLSVHPIFKFHLYDLLHQIHHHLIKTPPPSFSLSSYHHPNHLRLPLPASLMMKKKGKKLKERCTQERLEVSVSCHFMGCFTKKNPVVPTGSFSGSYMYADWLGS